MSAPDDAGERSSLPDHLAEHVDPSRLQELQLEVQLIEQWQFQSPILPPAILEQYEQIIPGFAERYFAAWERQGTHRQSLEASVVDTQTTTQRRAQPYTFALGALALLVALVLGLAGHEAAAIAIAGIDFASLGGVFVYGRWSNVQEARRKAGAVPEPEPPKPSASRGVTTGQGKPAANPNRSKKKKRKPNRR